MRQLNEIEKEIGDKRTSITIMKYNSKGPGWYEQYRVTDEKILEIVNKLWKDIIDKNRMSILSVLFL